MDLEIINKLFELYRKVLMLARIDTSLIPQTSTLQNKNVTVINPVFAGMF